MDIIIRRATQADLPAIVALNDALFREDAGQRDPLVNHDWARQHGQAYFAGLLERGASAVLVAEAEGPVVGYLSAYTYGPSDFRPVVAAELESTCVDAAWRGRGVGARLVQVFLAWAQERGAVLATVTAYAANARALAFYERHGFGPHTVTLGQRLASVEKGPGEGEALP
jgi:ribosomal protein S18 acetylase RimI-like enzyme